MHRFVQHGLSMFTWGDNPTPYEQTFEAIKAGIDSLKEIDRAVLARRVLEHVV